MRIKDAIGYMLAVASLSFGVVAAIGAQSKDVSRQTSVGPLTKTSEQKVPPASHSTGQSVPSAGDNGDVIYAQNCSRCHDAPDALDHRITGTVLRHMRTRANLSEADEKALLKFFNAH